MPDALPIGRVVATELKPATPHQFHFWTARESPIGIGAIVRVDVPGRVVFGIVTDGFAYSDLDAPIHDVIGADGDPSLGGRAPTARAEIRLYQAAVLRQLPEQPMQPVPLGAVYLAGDADVAEALRMDAFLGGERPTGVPVGVYAAGGRDAPIFLDADFAILGAPDAAYRQYVADVRAEYAHVDDAGWKTGRGAFLKKTLASPRIFRTGIFEGEYADQARKNIAWELQELERV